jgi:beta-1,4-mannosyl-glycoprotein beta-1,4-N-acetylglucosaminyltransferase
MTRYDCCMFYNENDLFELRLNQHWEFIDKFIVIEAGETHTGIKKELCFDHVRFSPWASKIEYRSFDNFEEAYKLYPELLDSCALSDRGPNYHSDDWTRDHFQYNYIYKVLLDLGAKDNDIAYVSCCDEILKREAFDACVQALDNAESLNLLFMFKYRLYAYKFNLLNLTWQQSDSSGGLCKVGSFKQTLPATLRDGRIYTHLVNDAGWHFTFLDNKNGEKVLAKQRAWAHSRDVRPGEKRKFDNTTKEEAIQKLYTDYKLTKVDITLESHPKYLVENLEKFKDFIQ